jgi:hypothetical protein
MRGRTERRAAPGSNRATTPPSSCGHEAAAQPLHRSSGRERSPWRGSRCRETTTPTAAEGRRACQGDGAGTANGRRGPERPGSAAAPPRRASAPNRAGCLQGGNRRHGRNDRSPRAAGPGARWSTVLGLSLRAQVAGLRPLGRAPTPGRSHLRQAVRSSAPPAAPSPRSDSRANR